MTGMGRGQSFIDSKNLFFFLRFNFSEIDMHLKIDGISLMKEDLLRLLSTCIRGSVSILYVSIYF